MEESKFNFDSNNQEIISENLINPDELERELFLWHKRILEIGSKDDDDNDTTRNYYVQKLPKDRSGKTRKPIKLQPIQKDEFSFQEKIIAYLADEEKEQEKDIKEKFKKDESKEKQDVQKEEGLFEDKIEEEYGSEDNITEILYEQDEKHDEKSIITLKMKESGKSETLQISKNEENEIREQAKKKQREVHFDIAYEQLLRQNWKNLTEFEKEFHLIRMERKFMGWKPRKRYTNIKVNKMIERKDKLEWGKKKTKIQQKKLISKKEPIKDQIKEAKHDIQVKHKIKHLKFKKKMDHEFGKIEHVTPIENIIKADENKLYEDFEKELSSESSSSSETSDEHEEEREHQELPWVVEMALKGFEEGECCSKPIFRENTESSYILGEEKRKAKTCKVIIYTTSKVMQSDIKPKFKRVCEIFDSQLIEYTVIDISTIPYALEKLKSHFEHDEIYFPQIFVGEYYFGDIDTVRYLYELNKLKERIEFYQKDILQESGIVVYTTSLKSLPESVEKCHKICQILDKNEIKYKEVDVSLLNLGHMLRRQLNLDNLTLPLIYVNGICFGGADLLLRKLEKDKFLSELSIVKPNIACLTCGDNKFLTCPKCKGRGTIDVLSPSGLQSSVCIKCDIDNRISCTNCQF